MSPDDFLALNEQIAAMARAGLPLDQGLESLSRDMGRGELRRVTRKLVEDLRVGQPLDAALRMQSGTIPVYYAPLVAAGIRTGRLPIVLATLAHYSKSLMQMRAAIVDALLYPCIVLLFGLCLIGLMSFYILPQFDAIFQDFGLSLPWITKAVLEVGRVPPLAVGLALSALVLAAIIVWLLTRLSSEARWQGARLLYHVPLIGTIVRAARLAAFAELLAILIDNEVPLPEAFRVAGQSSPEPLMARQAEATATELERGTTLAAAISGRGLIPEWMAWMAGVGEKQGSLAEALREVSSVYRRQSETRIGVLRNVLPSFLIVFIAGIVITLFAAAVLMPMIKLIEGLTR